jgi:predicted O-methyltransferase YrrM
MRVPRRVVAVVAFVVWGILLVGAAVIAPDALPVLIGLGVGAVGLLLWKTGRELRRPIAPSRKAARRRPRRQARPNRPKEDQSGAGVARRLAQIHTELLAMADLNRGETLSDLDGRRRLVVVGEMLSELTDRVDRLSRSLVDGGPGVEPTASFLQMEALLALYYAIQPGRELPPSDGWSAMPDILLVLHNEIRRERPNVVLECGSGRSSVTMGYALRRQGHGRLVSLEHDAGYALKTRRLIADHGLEDIVEVIDAPLRTIAVGGEEHQWYDLSGLAVDTIDLVFVDGPPGGTGPRARFPALPLLSDRLPVGSVIVVDDYVRSDEKDMVAAWLAADPAWTVEDVAVERGGAILRRVEVAAAH